MTENISNCPPHEVSLRLRVTHSKPNHLLRRISRFAAGGLIFIATVNADLTPQATTQSHVENPEPAIQQLSPQLLSTLQSADKLSNE